MSINTCTLSGNLTGDMEVRTTQSGSPVGSFQMAVNDRRKDGNGQWSDYPNYISCVLFGSRAEKLQPYMTKGTKVMVQGKLRYSTWERDGQKRSKLEVIVDDIDFSGGQKTGGNNSQNHGQDYGRNQGGYKPENSGYYDDDIPF